VQSDGSFTVHNVPPGEVTLSLRGPSGDRPRVMVATVTAGVETYVDLSFTERRSSIQGTVRNERGVPVIGVALTARRWMANETLQRFTASTDDAGRYTLDVIQGETYSIAVRVGVFHEERAGVAAGARDVDFPVPMLGKARLQFVDAATSQTILVLRSRGHVAAWRQSSSVSYLPLVLGAIGADLKREGLLELELPLGRNDLRIAFDVDGYAPCDVLGALVTAEPDPEPLIVTLVRGATIVLRRSSSELATTPQHRLFLLTEAESAARALRGPFAQQGGESNMRIGGVNLWLADPTLMHRHVSFEADGAAFLRGIAPGRYVLRAVPDDLEFTPESIVVTGAERSVVDVGAKRR
jgi:hypothetical protein